MSLSNRVGAHMCFCREVVPLALTDDEAFNDESYSEDSDAAGMGRLSVRAWKIEKLGASHHRHC